MLHPEDHAAYLAKHDFVIPPGAFTAAEAELLTKYGRWMEALVSGALAPTTPSQEQFLRAAHGEAEPSTDFERAWTKLTKERVIGEEVTRKFQALSAARKRAADLDARYHAARQEVLAALREQLDAVDAQFAEQIQSATDDSAAAEKAVRELVLKLGRNISLAGIKVAYSPGRVTWDAEKMAAYAELHPEVKEFRKVGKPWVAVRFGDGGPSASESGESKPAE
jgi:uncharacterized protein YifE (UPF0438 family)